MHVSAIPSLAAFERNVRCLTASLLQRPCHGACSTCVNLCHSRSMFRLTPVAKPFWSRGWSDMLPLLPPPLGGRNWTSNSCSLFLDTRLVAPHCLSSSVFWRFRVRRLWSSLCCHSLACMRLVAACCKAVCLTHVAKMIRFCHVGINL